MLEIISNISEPEFEGFFLLWSGVVTLAPLLFPPAVKSAEFGIVIR